MNLQQLEYIIALDVHRNFVKAAEACHVTQPTLSMQVKKLEEEWGIVLFLRGNGPLEPTELGKSVLQRARRVMAEVGAMRECIVREQDSLVGNLRLGVIPTIAPYVLPLFLHAFAHDHAGLQLVVRELQSEEIIADLKIGDLDVGLLALPVAEEELEEMRLYSEPLWLCASSSLPEMPMNAGSLRKMGGPLLLTGGNCLREQVLEFCGTSAPAEAEVIYEGGSLEALMRFVGQGEGYTLVPELARPTHLPPGTAMRAFQEPVPTREIGLVVHPRFVRRKLVEQLAKAIRAAVPQHMLSNKGFRLQWRKP